VPVAKFLSDEWIAEFDRAAADATSLELADGAADLVVEHTVTDVPHGDTVRYHLHLTTGPARVRPGPAAEPTVTFRQDYPTAAAVAAGDGSAQAAFMAGRLQVGGHIDQLIARHGELAAVDDVFSGLRASTEF
jgi:hypothetical protein